MSQSLLGLGPTVSPGNSPCATQTVTKKDIAKQFALPERQAKVDQLVRNMPSQHTESNAIKYCICRSTDTSRFMIGCDNCNEWFHGDCISVTQEHANSIRQFFCEMCRERNPNLRIKYKSKKSKHESHRHLVENSGSDSDWPASSSKHSKKSARRDDSERRGGESIGRCGGECAAATSRPNCATCDFWQGHAQVRRTQQNSAEQCREGSARICLLTGGKPGKLKPFERPMPSVFATTEYEGSTDAFRHVGGGAGGQSQRRAKSSAHSKKYHRSRARAEEEEDEDWEEEPQSRLKKKTKYKKAAAGEAASDAVVVQCFGPGCVEEARPGSKYCNDECGMKMASSRIYELLPQRIQQWQSSPCIAEENNKKTLEKIRRRQQDARRHLGELDVRQQELEAHMERARHAAVANDDEGATDNESEESELNIFCVTCGHEVNARVALRHMEKCFAKYESHTSFGSIYKTRIEGQSMFCDAFNENNKTYCKRLRVLCPEHSKEPKVGPDEVCGCPLVADVFVETGEFCRAAKRKCMKHYKWEKRRLAEIDMERIRQVRHVASTRGGQVGSQRG
ncbi:PREDICTED: CXXC-type zinc finger protein 1-like [Priapulus caudatus]|uniref:CXXC-type zinc finger protein 1 n=1 Tax=Priapulus caudatus TaxID=37621 RepID=A0ABM1EXB3_PRICU|nr:PREDICTED: CXXC-type zinc finger protein 1-like [Priapulus caudatus]